MNNLHQNKAELYRLYNLPRNRRLKYAVYAAAAVAILLLLVMAIWIDAIPAKLMLFMRGCVGLAAIVFVALAGVLYYRVNKQYIENNIKK